MPEKPQICGVVSPKGVREEIEGRSEIPRGVCQVQEVFQLPCVFYAQAFKWEGGTYLLGKKQGTSGEAVNGLFFLMVFPWVRFLDVSGHLLLRN